MVLVWACALTGLTEPGAECGPQLRAPQARRGCSARRELLPMMAVRVGGGVMVQDQAGEQNMDPDHLTISDILQAIIEEGFSLGEVVGRWMDFKLIKCLYSKSWNI